MKKIVVSFFLILIVLFSIFYPVAAIAASKNAILIWSQQILPTLLPFSILSAVVIQSNFLGNHIKQQNLLAISIVFLCGFAFGFPIGSKLASDFYQKQMLTKKQAHILAVTANNFSPMYVCGFVLPFLFPEENFKMISYILLYAFPLSIGVCLLLFSLKDTFNHENAVGNHKNTASRFQLDMQIIDAGIVSSFETLIKLCGYIVMFSLLSSIFQTVFQTPYFAIQLLIGNMEITNGIALFSEYAIDTNVKYICIIQFLSLGGLSGFAQTASILQHSKLSIKTYILGKCSLSFTATILAVILFHYRY